MLIWLGTAQFQLTFWKFFENLKDYFTYELLQKNWLESIQLLAQHRKLCQLWIFAQYYPLCPESHHSNQEYLCDPHKQQLQVFSRRKIDFIAKINAKCKPYRFPWLNCNSGTWSQQHISTLPKFFWEPQYCNSHVVMEVCKAIKLLVPYSLTKKVKFRLHMKDYTWVRKSMIINWKSQMLAIYKMAMGKEMPGSVTKFHSYFHNCISFQAVGLGRQHIMLYKWA